MPVHMPPRPLNTRLSLGVTGLLNQYKSYFDTLAAAPSQPITLDLQTAADAEAKIGQKRQADDVLYRNLHPQPFRTLS